MLTKVETFEIKIFKGTFCYHDVEKKGYITKTELRESFRTLGHNPTEQELWKLLAQVARKM